MLNNRSILWIDLVAGGNVDRLEFGLLQPTAQFSARVDITPITRLKFHPRIHGGFEFLVRRVNDESSPIRTAQGNETIAFQDSSYLRESTQGLRQMLEQGVRKNSVEGLLFQLQLVSIHRLKRDRK